MSGPHFRDYHLMFGHRTLTSIGEIARRQSISDNDDAKVAAAAMLEELHSDNLKLVAKLREVKELAAEAGDNATDGLLDDWTDQAEERAWFLFEIAQKD